MKNNTLVTGLAGLLIAFFVLAGVGWADGYFGDRHRGRHGYYRENPHFDKWDRHRKWEHRRYQKWDRHRKWDHRRYDKRNRGHYNSFLDKDRRRHDRYWHKRYDRKHKVRPYYNKHIERYYRPGYWYMKPYYGGPKRHSAFAFGTSIFDPGFFFGLTIRDIK